MDYKSWAQTAEAQPYLAKYGYGQAAQPSYGGMGGGFGGDSYGAMLKQLYDQSAGNPKLQNTYVGTYLDYMSPEAQMARQQAQLQLLAAQQQLGEYGGADTDRKLNTAASLIQLGKEIGDQSMIDRGNALIAEVYPSSQASTVVPPGYSQYHSSMQRTLQNANPDEMGFEAFNRLSAQANMTAPQYERFAPAVSSGEQWGAYSRAAQQQGLGGALLQLGKSIVNPFWGVGAMFSGNSPFTYLLDKEKIRRQRIGIQ